jgi:hypothetical protein
MPTGFSVIHLPKMFGVMKLLSKALRVRYRRGAKHAYPRLSNYRTDKRYVIQKENRNTPHQSIGQAKQCKTDTDTGSQAQVQQSH